MSKRSINYIKPDDPPFLRELKLKAGYDDRNHKFDELENAEEDFIQDQDNEQPQVVVLKPGDLTAEEAEAEQQKIDKEKSEEKADLSQRVIFKKKVKPDSNSTNEVESKKRKHNDKDKVTKDKKSKPLLSFNDDDEDEDEND